MDTRHELEDGDISAEGSEEMEVEEGEAAEGDMEEEKTRDVAIKGRMHAIGERLSSAMDLNDPDRIMRLVEWELKKKEEAEEMEKKRGLKRKRKRRSVH